VTQYRRPGAVPLVVDRELATINRELDAGHGPNLHRVGHRAPSGRTIEPGYTSGMKTAVSIPDELFRRADELASRLGKSRSELYREALHDYLARRDPKAVTAALNDLADELANDHADLVAAAARQTLTRTEW